MMWPRCAQWIGIIVAMLLLSACDPLLSRQERQEKIIQGYHEALMLACKPATQPKPEWQEWQDACLRALGHMSNAAR